MSEKQEETFDYDQQPSIIDYLKEHNTILVASISGIIAVFSFLVNALSYISMTIILNEYFILPGMVRNNGQGKLFIDTITLFVFCFTLLVSSFIIGQFLKRYIIFSSFYRYNKIYAEKSSIDNVDIEYPLNKQKKHSRVVLVNTIYRIVGCIVVVILVGLLFEATQFFFLGFSFFPLIMYIIMILGIGIYMSLMETKEYRRKNIVKIITSVLENEDETKRKNEYKHYYIKFYNDATTILLKKWKITKMHIISGCIICVAAVTAAFGCIIASSTIRATKNKVYNIYYDEGKTYAVVYQDDNYYVMEEASIKENVLYIYLNRQRFLATDDISFEYRGFDNVIKTGLPYIQDVNSAEEEETNISINDTIQENE